MLGSFFVWTGFVFCVAGALLVLRPMARLGVGTRRKALGVLLAAVACTTIGFALPAPESRVAAPISRLDAIVPAWQFNEVHTLRVNAPPERVYDAMLKVRADEIALFRLLTWIRRGGRDLPQNILNAGDREPLIDVALRTTFVKLVDDAPRELVFGTVVVAPDGAGRPMEPAFFAAPPPGFAVAVMNFAVRPDGEGRSVLSTETRVFANGAAARRGFAAYWRVIYPGSAIIRLMWLRAIARRATG